MVELQRLAAGHAAAVLAFERANRTFFAASVSDRGDDYFAQFADRHRELLAEQEVGDGVYSVLVDDDGAVLGRFNLYVAGDGVATLGYRVAEAATGRGVATVAVSELCATARSRYGLTLLRAAAADANGASRRVLAKTGFSAVGPTGPDEVGGKPGTWYERDL